MKRIVIILFLLLPASFTYAADDMSTIFDEGNTAYMNADYRKAIGLYDSILASGHSSAQLYYNLGNAYFKENKIGPAILNYNRALRLSPTDSDVKYNLTIAGGLTKDKIERVPEFFVKTWVRSLRQSLSTDTWAALSLAMLTLSMGAALFYLLSGKMALRKTGFYTSLCAFVLFIVSLSFSSRERKDLLHSKDAIIMQSSVAVKSSPDKASIDRFVLHEGTKVEVLNTLGGWNEIMIADGNKGWVPQTSLEVI